MSDITARPISCSSLLRMNGGILPPFTPGLVLDRARYGTICAVCRPKLAQTLALIFDLSPMAQEPPRHCIYRKITVLTRWTVLDGTLSSVLLTILSGVICY